MNHRPLSNSAAPALSVNVKRAAVSALLLAATAAWGATPPKPADNAEVYHLYAGSTHAHTQLTWSHGEQWVAAAKGEKKSAEGGEKKEGGLKISAEGVQGPPAGNTLRPDWQKDNQGMPADHFARAKAKGYDFYTTTDHSQEATLHPPSPKHPKWVETHQQAKAATDSAFVALVGYEHSENNGPGGSGHLNVINSGEYINALAPGMDLPKLYQWLQTVPSAGDGPVVAVFNHPSPKQYNEFAYRDAGVTDVITMLEVINSNKNIHYAGFLAALDKGWKVSPVCGNDNHGFYGIEKHTSRTYVLATSKTKAAILDAMKHRRTYATLEQNLQCRYTVNGAIMGSTLVQPDTLEFAISLRDPDTTEEKDKITKIDIVTETGEVVETHEPTPAHEITWKPTLRNATKKYYFIRVWNAGGGDLSTAKPADPVAWLAPIWTGR
ncbi:MAG: hypothetical protein V4773_27035 [Verrucomicrobiota bacterium]